MHPPTTITATEGTTTLGGTPRLEEPSSYNPPGAELLTLGHATAAQQLAGEFSRLFGSPDDAPATTEKARAHVLADALALYFIGHSGESDRPPGLHVASFDLTASLLGVFTDNLSGTSRQHLVDHLARNHRNRL